MDVSYRMAPGEIVAPNALTLHRARQLCHVACSDASPYVSFVEARRLRRGWEVVVCDVEVEVGQRTVYDIRRRERMAVVVPDDDADIPMTLALRSDFPTVPHVYPATADFPAALCLYEQPNTEVRLGWTPTGYLRRIRDWLALTARGELHGEDQPLEPLLLASVPALIVPHDLVPMDGNVPQHLLVHARDGGNGRHVYVAERPDAVTVPTQRVECVAVVIGGAPQPHGIIRRVPDTLADLHEFLETAGMDLRTQLAGALRAWGRNRERLGLSLMLIVVLPKVRHAGVQAEGEELWAFYSHSTIGTIGEALGLWQVRDGHAGLLLSVSDVCSGGDVPLELLNPIPLLSRDRAAELNGHATATMTRLVAIGLGALGSQVFMNLARAGCGQWTLVDNDHLLPHNLARHALDGRSLGGSKAAMQAAYANSIIAGPPIAVPLIADVLAPGQHADALWSALSEADVVVDMSAALAVERYVARDAGGAARRASVFLNPAGTDVVLLVEDAHRRTPLDWAEMLYYRHILHEPALASHQNDSAGRVRYGGNCRDVSSALPQEQVALLAAIASCGLRQALDVEDATIGIWQSGADLTVTATRAQPSTLIERRFDGWTLCTDTWLINQVKENREARLPNETGGVLIGCYDMQRRIIYVVDGAKSPPDSIEWPTLYIRGCVGLPERLEAIGARTGGVLCYVGEWHTHTGGQGPAPSNDDHTAFRWLADWMALDACLALMLIVGDSLGWYVGIMP